MNAFNKTSCPVEIQLIDPVEKLQIVHPIQCAPHHAFHLIILLSALPAIFAVKSLSFPQPKP